MDIRSLLKSNGKSLTQERIEIFQGIQDVHLFQAADLVQKFPHIGRASIFRILSLFVDIGALRKLSLDNKGDFYELTSHWHHEHFECNSCHRILSFDTGIICKTLDFMAKKQWFFLQSHQVLLSGLCSQCYQR